MDKYFTPLLKAHLLGKVQGPRDTNYLLYQFLNNLYFFPKNVSTVDQNYKTMLIKVKL